MATYTTVTIHDIPELKNKMDNLDKLFSLINYGGFGFAYGYVVSSLSVGYPSQILDPSYTFDVDGTIRVIDKTYLFDDVYIDKNTYIEGMTILNDILTVNSSSYLNSNTFISGETYLYDILDVSDNASFHSNVQIDNDLDIYNNITINGNEYLYQTLNVSGNVSLLSDLEVGNNTTISGNTWVLGNEYLYQNLNVSGNVSLLSNLEVGNNTTISGDSYLLGNEYLYQNLNVSGNVSLLSDLEVGNNTTISGNTWVLGNEYLYQKLNVSGNVSLLSNLEVGNNTTISGNAWVLGNEYLYQNLNVSGNVSILSALQVGNNTTISGNAWVLGNEYLYQNLNVSGNTILLGRNDIYGDTSFNSSNLELDSIVKGYNSFTIKNKSSTQKNASFNLGTISNDVNDSIEYNAFIYGKHKFDGDIIIGKGDTGVSTTFDLSAGYNSYGIKYDGPVNIGKNTSTTFNLDAKDGTINYAGNINVYSQLRIKPGGLFVIEASANSITMLETQTEVTNQFNVSNNGTGPALIVNQIDSHSYDIANFQDNNQNVFTIGYDGDTQIRGRMSLGYEISSQTPFNSIDDNLPTLDVSGQMRVTGDLLVVGDITSYSDIRIKTNISPLTNCLEHLDSLGGYKYTRTDILEKDKVHIGLIAQEVERFYPELITEKNNIKSINYQSFSAILLESMKELKQQNKNLLKRIELLEKIKY